MDSLEGGIPMDEGLKTGKKTVGRVNKVDPSLCIQNIHHDNMNIKVQHWLYYIMFYIYNIAWRMWKTPPHSRYSDTWISQIIWMKPMESIWMVLDIQIWMRINRKCCGIIKNFMWIVNFSQSHRDKKAWIYLHDVLHNSLKMEVHGLKQRPK